MAKAKVDNTLMPKPKPHLTVDDSDVPQLKDWKIDEEYTFEVRAKLTSLDRNDWTEGKPLEGRFQITSIKSDDDDPGMKGFDSYKGDREKPKGRS